ncbi:uncharacterized protein LOC125788836 [Astyanax mexicanus]|uniref:uncharacterized protein LOC125788836 n=1 Tax=Astyanax mexicanus TaxID=7994 RepID=UPI0020CA9F6C|nr:uncharacterized protein LOC125788836 [Astyanax mexicanus]
MLLKVRYHGTKKYIRLPSDFTYLDFISEVKNKFGIPSASELYIFDESNTAVEEDILLELMEANPDLCLTVCDGESDEDQSASSSLTDTLSPSSDNDLFSQRSRNRPVHNFRDGSPPTTVFSEAKAAKEVVENALVIKPGGQDVLEEYKADKSLNHRTRRQLVNILASHMTEMHGRIPSRKQKEKYALGIITLFPSLKDPFSPKGYVSLKKELTFRNYTQELAELTLRCSCSVFQSCCSIDEHLRGREGKQPYILAVGRAQKRVDTFYIIVDKQLIPCQATRSLGAFDELFKSHYVFNLSYDGSLVHFYTFVQTTVYSIDITTTNESPRVREFRAKLFN